MVDEAVAEARASFPVWRDTDWHDRIAILREGDDAVTAVKYEISIATGF